MHELYPAVQSSDFAGPVETGARREAMALVPSLRQQNTVSCHIFRHRSPSRRCVRIPFEKDALHCRNDWCSILYQLKLEGRRQLFGSFFPKPWMESCQWAALKSIQRFHISGHSDRNNRVCFSIIHLYIYM